MSAPAYLNDLGVVCALGRTRETVARKLFAAESGLTLTEA